MSGDPFQIVNSGIRANMQRTSVRAQNVTNATQPGYTKKDIDIVSNFTGGEVSGVIAKKAHRQVNSSMVKQIRSQQSDVSNLSIKNEYAVRIQQLHGNKGNQGSLSYKLQEVTEALNTVSSNIKHPNTTKVLHSFDNFSKQMRETDSALEDITYEIHSNQGKSINLVNQHLRNIRDAGQQIFTLGDTNQSTADLYDIIDREIHELSKQMNVNVTFSKETVPSITITTRTGVMLLSQSNTVNEIKYESNSNLLPGDSLPEITVDGKNISNEITTGKMRAHMDIVNTNIKDLRAELDEITFQIRDNVNEIHNLGTPEELRKEITGSVGVPGQKPISGASVISGQGTLRLGVMTINSEDREMVSYHDIPLSDNMTMSSLINTINSGTSGVTAEITADGRFKLSTSTPNGGVVMGSFGTSPRAEMSSGNSLDPNNKWGFSHFFGLNNILETGEFLPGERGKGIAGQLSVRDNLKNNGTLLSFSELKNDAIIGSSVKNPIERRDTSVTQALSKRIRSDLIKIPASGHLPAFNTSLIDYTSRIIDGTTNFPNDTKNALDQKVRVLEEISHKANELSGVDVRDEVLAMVQISQNQQVLYKTLQIAMDMIKELQNSIRVG